MSQVLFSSLTKFKKSEIETLFQTASLFFKSPVFVLLRAPAMVSYGRLLLVVPKKIGSAPERNKLRRRLKSIFYQNQLFNCGKDVIFIAKSSQIKKNSFEELQKILVSRIAK